MADDRALHVAFLTNFSDTCFRVIPALAQLCDAVTVQLTLVHAYEPARESARVVDATLRSFFPEAQRYAGCRRLAIAGTPVTAVRQLEDAGRLDLVVAPAGDPLGLPRFTHSSLRARLVRDVSAPMWTVGPGASASVLGRPHRNVACCVHVGRSGWAHLRRACDYAQALGAALHVIHVLPDVHDGSLLRLAYAEPFDEAATAARVRALSEQPDVTPRRHAVPARDLRAALDAIDADIVFVDGAQWITRRLVARRVSHTLDGLRRPVVCVGPGEGPAWPLVPRRHERTRRWSDAAFEARPEPIGVAVRSGPTLVSRRNAAV